MRTRHYRFTTRFLTVLALGAPACSQILGADFEDLLPLEDASAGSGGTNGGRGGNDAGPDSSAGSGGVSGSSGSAGSSGASGRGGTAGNAGGAGKGGSAGVAGSAGSGGSAGSDAGDGGPRCSLGPRDAGAATGAPADIVINEVQADTQAPALQDYVELFNSGSAPVDLSGYKVGDGEVGPDGGIIPCPNEFALFPTGTVLQPGGFIVVLANLSARSGPLCCFNDVGPCYTAEFGISNSGERVFLCDPSGGAVSEAEFPTSGVSQGESYGRVPDGSGAFQTTRVTPGAVNQAL
ncbi:MAG TPA: lamin tail domain-containing protein [Polyangiaceae bacterium]|nr:lamin tail domain-containing protein [Polyangiaceae bacterium]